MFKPISDLVKSLQKDSQELLTNRYKIGNLVGKGAMGQVYKAFDTNNNDTVVAIKFLSQALLDSKMRDRFQKEAKISALLGEQSDHIVRVKDYGVDDSQVPFYVMEYLEGYDLDQLVKKKPLSFPKFLSLIRQICLGLECAHNGILVNNELAPIIHRDIKPSNIFLAKDEKGGHFVKILDFGIAQIHNPDESLTQKSFMGTPEYCSPEQMAEDELKATSDIYSLGVLMYQMLTQQTPIKAEAHNFQSWYKAHNEFPPKKLPTYLELPKDLDDLIMSCLHKSPARRPQNIREILKVIIPLDREYNSDGEINQKSQEASSALLPINTVYRQSFWPQDKPQKKIVFPNLVEAQEGAFSSLWSMLESDEVLHFQPKSTFCFTHFMFQATPHPMILWVNLLYNRTYEPKWLPCYLDLKTDIGAQISTNLISQKKYHILLFELGHPSGYKQKLTVNVASEKLKQLQNFLLKASSWQGEGQPEGSKIILKKQFESVKKTILAAVARAK
ncbi:serine/threonine-protein kinase [Cyanobacterium sp. IPPAS B-1200]|uniref:serine/threonine-protein kinase n=1 Tax=Cyanobacterium sp. IPPAS B-1200 TaxID=1562720 RepID=UPI0008525089|nr:serine/threonine-protein kinase [Cyanobacterium sp. IPPAS B-1200]OEJ78164.1 serine/threonine protein kinase [Cyanobacterium sp. IPPAS B-1200]